MFYLPKKNKYFFCELRKNYHKQNSAQTILFDKLNPLDPKSNAGHAIYGKSNIIALLN